MTSYPTGRLSLPPTSKYRTIHQANPSSPIGKAVADLPAWVAARDALLAYPPPAAFIDPDEEVTDRLDDELRQGRMLSDAQAGKILIEAQGAAALVRASNRLRERASVALDGAVTGNLRALFRHLDGQLQELLAEARTILDGFGGADPGVEAAADAGKLAEFKRLRTLRTTYATLRSDQNRLWNIGEGSGRKMRDFVTAFLADPMAVDPELVARRLRWKIPTAHGERDPRQPPWPTEPWSPEALDWCVQHPEAKPWIASPRQCDAVAERITKACQAASAERSGRPHKGSLTQTGRRA